MKTQKINIQNIQPGDSIILGGCHGAIERWKNSRNGVTLTVSIEFPNEKMLLRKFRRYRKCGQSLHENGRKVAVCMMEAGTEHDHLWMPVKTMIKLGLAKKI